MIRPASTLRKALPTAPLDEQGLSLLGRRGWQEPPAWFAHGDVVQEFERAVLAEGVPTGDAGDEPQEEEEDQGSVRTSRRQSVSRCPAQGRKPGARRCLRLNLCTAASRGLSSHRRGKSQESRTPMKKRNDDV